MATNPNTLPENAGRITAPDANYTYGSAKDDSTGTTGDGTPIKKAILNDTYGFQQALLRAAGIVPTGNAETQLASQYMQAVVELASGRAFNYDESGVADGYILDLRANQQGVAAYFEGMIARFTPGNTNTGPSTVNVNGLGVTTIRQPGGLIDVTAGDLIAGQTTTLIYRTSPGVHFELQDSGDDKVGTVVGKASSIVPEGYLECDGSAISRTTYAVLFADIGTLYGIGDGATTFNIPDLRGEFIRGWDNGRGIDPARAIATFQADAFESHNHQIRDRNLYPLSGGSLASAAGVGSLTGNFSELTGGTETRPRNIAMMYCIKF